MNLAISTIFQRGKDGIRLMTFQEYFWILFGNKQRRVFLTNPEKVAWQTEFPLPEKKGHLIVNLKQSIRTEDKVPLFVSN